MDPAFKPMLADKLPEGKEPLFPCYVSAKLDGVRAIVFDGVVYSRNLKPIPNQHVQRCFGRPELNGFDGELIVGDPCDPLCMSNTTSGVMRKDGEPDVHFHVFDHVGEGGFDDRRKRLASLRQKATSYAHVKRLQMVRQVLCKSQEQLLEFEQQMLSEGYEGVMLRSLNGPYKFGRATFREGYLLKLKRFHDGEALVLGCEELENNENEAKRDELGRSKRSSAKEGKVAAGVLGNLLVRDIKTGVEFSIGSGLSAHDRATLWQQRAALVGRLVTYRYFPTGTKEKPRFPVFVSFRDPADM